jgi:Tn3 transposase DDE domain
VPTFRRVQHRRLRNRGSPELKRNLLAVLIANATNLGLVRMAEACGISYDVLSWTAEWYVREETLRAANLAIVSWRQFITAGDSWLIIYALARGWPGSPRRTQPSGSGYPITAFGNAQGALPDTR